ncbi:MAG: manganese efflux pump MntP family protein [Fibrobacteraceae bacterium]|nr:manganese efflux pump MntP family protein [Fibrobacteraceae bacterium]
MDILSILLISFVLAMDCFAVSVSTGLCHRNLSQAEIIKMGLFFGGFQTGMTLAGYVCGNFLAEKIGSVDHWIAFALLLLLGIKMIVEGISGGEDENFCKKLSIKMLVVLAVATSLDALAVGVMFGLVGSTIAIASILIGAVSLLMTEIGANIGKKAGHKISAKWAEIAGGAVLIGIGVKILYQHLTGNQIL